jgi:hypothetical protein
VVVVALGFYLGWFNVSSHGDKGQSDITLSVDKNKLEADKDKAVDKVEDLRRKAEAKLAPTTRKSQD